VVCHGECDLMESNSHVESSSPLVDSKSTHVVLNRLCLAFEMGMQIWNLEHDLEIFFWS
jgi:hypothetical protein